MTKPERGQMPFIFERRPDQSQIYYELGFLGRENPEEVGRFVRTLQEELWACILNTKNRITHEAMIYRGTVNSINIRPAELFKEAVRVNAPALVLSHIHPRRSTEPSPPDIQVTEQAVAAGKLLGIDVLDHIIIGKDSWLSLKEKGLGFFLVKFFV